MGCAAKADRVRDSTSQWPVRELSEGSSSLASKLAGSTMTNDGISIGYTLLTVEEKEGKHSWMR